MSGDRIADNYSGEFCVGSKPCIRCNRFKNYNFIDRDISEFSFQTRRLKNGDKVWYPSSYCRKCSAAISREVRNRARLDGRLRQWERNKARKRRADAERHEKYLKYQREWARMRNVLQGKRIRRPRVLSDIEIEKIPFRQEFADWYFSFKDEKRRSFEIEYHTDAGLKWHSWLGFHSRKEFETFERSLRGGVDRKNLNASVVNRVLLAAECEIYFDRWWPPETRSQIARERYKRKRIICITRDGINYVKIKCRECGSIWYRKQQKGIIPNKCELCRRSRILQCSQCRIKWRVPLESGNYPRKCERCKNNKILHCKNGDHEWWHPIRQGVYPKSCPECR